MKGLVACLVLCCVALTGCASMSATKAPNADLSTLKTFYVPKLTSDERGIERLIAERLVQMGYAASHGASAQPENACDAIVTYQDRWAWDITMYMIRLNVQVRDGRTGSILAVGESMRPSLQRKSPEKMVEEVLTEIFKQ